MKINIPFILVFCACFVLVHTTAISQNLSLTWSSVLNNPLEPLGGGVTGRAVKVDGDGNIYVVGNFSRTADFDPGPGVANLVSVGGLDVFIAKYDANGNYIYAKSFGGLNDDLPYSLAIDAAGCLYMVGYFAGTADFNPGPGVANLTSAGSYDIFIAKYDAFGNYIYAKSIGGAGFDYAGNLLLDGSGNIYVTGHFIGTSDFDPGPGVANLTSVGNADIFFAKYDADANYIYAKSVGGTGNDFANGLTLDGSGNVYVTGSFTETVDFDPGPGVENLVSSAGGWTSIFLAKYDASGNYVFAKAMVGSSNGSGVANDLVYDDNGNIYVTGDFRGTVDFDPGPGVVNLTTAGGNDIFIARYDVNGNYVYAKGMMGGMSDNSYGYKLLLDGSGNLYVTGNFRGTVDFDPGPGVANLTTSTIVHSDLFIAKYDTNANYIYANSIVGTSGNDYVSSITLDAGGNIYVTGNFGGTVDFDPGAGVANLTSGAGSNNAYLTSYSNIGEYRFAGLLGGYSAYTLPDISSDVVVDGSGNVYITGAFSGTVDFDPGPGIADLTSTVINTTDIFIAKYDANGNYVYAKSMGGTGADNSNSLKLDNSGNIYITGTFSGAADFDPGAGVANQVSNGSTDIFIAKYDADGNYIYAKSIGGTSTENSARLSVDGNANVYITGFYQGTVDFNPGAGVANLVSVGAPDIFIAKYDANGNYVYAKSMGGTGADYGNSLMVDGGGNLYVTGRFSGTVDFNPGAGVANLVSAGGFDIFIAKYDINGNYVYAKKIGGINDDYGNDLFVDATGNVYAVGNFTGTVDFDPGAGVANLVSAGGSDIFIAKYNSVGNYIYTKSIGGTGTDVGNSLKLDGSGNVYAIGNFSGTVDFDAGAGVANLVSAGGSDIFITKYDASGNYVYAKSIGGASVDNGNSIVYDGGGNVYITGNFTGTADFDPNANVQLQTAWNSSDIYLVKLAECLVPEIANYSTPAFTTAISGPTLITDGGCSLLASIIPNGANPVSGMMDGKVWIESSVPVYGGKPFVARHYELTPTVNPSTSTAKVTLYFTQQEFDDFNAHPASTLNLPASPSDVTGKNNLRIGKYSGSSNNGTGLPGTYPGSAVVIDPDDADIVWNSTYNRWEVSFDVDGFSGFIIQTSDILLPLTLLDFNGRIVNNNAVLGWKTENENNSSEFVIERSVDTRNYSAIGNVAAFNTTGTHQYNFTDSLINMLSANVIYYRLKLKDIDGKFSYSKVVPVSLSYQNVVLLYPNPAKEFVNITITMNRPEKVKMRMMDNTGRMVKLQEVNLIRGSSSLSIDISSLAKGVYYLELKGETINISRQFVKQ